ncbi:high affinity cGMP-specific 3',5'-cyclic phosphodiesterase 9A [Schistocerca serialis cubense]|uniref:high affinity cGMP-specific 3',5'-cyclic phosphodiesterase 9A n=1 Tax=Schistocerca serialis cubense TaxID=2023355 RepID=UPI00214E5C86|nr:high affinity cGMP-specific 3',5'-cyclic phosphodiesterase 9A [Schistocerca serialis cubense]
MWLVAYVSVTHVMMRAQNPDCGASQLAIPSSVLQLFRSAAEAGPLDIVKLYGCDGRLLNISPALKDNAPDRPYRLEVVAAHCNGMLLDEVGIDIRGLEERVARLERQIRMDFEELPPSVRDLKEQVDAFRIKLETTEHLSWMGFYKELPPPLSTEACRRLQYRRKSDSVRRRVREKFYKICDASVSAEVRARLRQPTFDGCQWEDEEVLLLLQLMYTDLELHTRFAIELPVLRRFLYEVYNNYNEVPFHNFRHSFCVAQMMYAMMWAVDLPAKLGDLETLVLLTSCICHDLDHPGYNNIYQINAKTELALRYNDISPLENHHCSVAFRILERPDCNILRSLDAEAYRRAREGIIRCILATDMARHNEILDQFREITPRFDFKDRAHVNLLCMVLIKVADISNEARPMEVAEPWLDRLLQEFFKQSDAEKLEGLPVTPFMDRDKITKPSSQCSFIGFVLLPLFEALGDLFPALNPLLVQPVRDALDHYRRLNEAAKDEQRAHRKSVSVAVDAGGGAQHPGDAAPEAPAGGLPKSTSGQSVRSRRALCFKKSKSRSRSTDEEAPPAAEAAVDGSAPAGPDSQAAADAMPDVAEEEPAVENDVARSDGEEEVEDDEDEEEEAITEVEVSEKTLKFKIATSEGPVTSTTGRKSIPGSRKGSREGEFGSVGYYGGRKRSVVSPASSGGGELCNGGGAPGSHSGRSSLDSRRQGPLPPDEAEENPPAPATQTVTDYSAAASTQGTPSDRAQGHAKPSILARWKALIGSVSSNSVHHHRLHASVGSAPPGAGKRSPPVSASSTASPVRQQKEATSPGGGWISAVTSTLGSRPVRHHQPPQRANTVAGGGSGAAGSD